jgi:hypothetical protein
MEEEEREGKTKRQRRGKSLEGEIGREREIERMDDVLIPRTTRKKTTTFFERNETKMWRRKFLERRNHTF